ncbi:protein of unknown function [Candidatus Nitrosocosmicus franklandus]|uniref:Uncharacterized protein n=1 Tax=Candidatus Nitrosocosmicus franklandianus TaxID=1798806 RepID=A0A484ICM2_9ARCH|nr:protein of unknown function [Candidatus Nitrosocosmicus franklandus]
MHKDCKNLLELCKRNYLFAVDSKGDLVSLNDLSNLSSFSSIIMEISDEKGIIYRVPIKCCLDCGKKLLNQDKTI